ncbi:pancreatic secretory granule membrane major glycoprotein GP2-like [Mixophyes fleayi]|uniref:pancreatic secretory granule membrane major glycoprotein GP2-like n=1 Tax=Mixophyes fleayi TaxID=3061075 RepID=UPI003F4DD014
MREELREWHRQHGTQVEETDGGSGQGGGPVDDRELAVADLNPTVRCDDGAMTTSISVCQLQQLRYNYSTLHLMNTSSDCSYTYLKVINNVRVWSIQVAPVPGYCGNIVTEDSSKIYFTNTLQIDQIAEPLITRNPFIYNFTCAYNLYPVLSTTIIPSTPYKGPMVTMAAYKDAANTIPIASDDMVYVGDIVYLGLFSPETDGNVFALRAETCVASPTNDRNDSNIVQVVSGGCAVSGDVSTSVLTNGVSQEARIQISSFLFQGYDAVYIFCDVRLCNISDGCTGCNNSWSGESFPVQLNETLHPIGCTQLDTLVSAQQGNKGVKERLSGRLAGIQQVRSSS